jgi:ubiquitin-protein ligase
MHESPRLRRLRNDLAALERLRDESSVLRFRASGKPAQHYVIEFKGKSLARFRGKVSVSDRHEVEIKLGASYPRTMPEIRWMTPIYHPNISEIGMVCLGGYGTHWVPSLNLDELVGMLWDMARYHNYDVRSPYNRDAALWVANQTTFGFPLDGRPLRDLRARLGRVEAVASPASPSLLKRIFGRGPAPSRDGGRVFAAGADGTVEPLDLPPNTETATAPAPDPAAPVMAAASATAAPPADLEDDGLIILDTPSTPERPVSLRVLENDPAGPYHPPAEPDRPVRLRAQDEEIVFID